MKRLLTLAFLFLATCARGQLDVFVTADTNGFITGPTNFFQASSNYVNTAVNNTQTNRDYFWRTNAAGSGSFSNLFTTMTTAGTHTHSGPVTVTGTVQATNFSGVVGSLTNGGWLNPNTTNLINSGNAISSRNITFVGAEQFGSGASAAAIGAVALGGSSFADGFTAAAIGNAAVAHGASSTAVGVSAVASNANAMAIGNLTVATNNNSSAIGTSVNTTKDNQVRVGTASQYLSVPGGSQVEGYTTNFHGWGTNIFDAGSDVSFGRYSVSSLANGNNAAVPAGTNVFVEVSGPSGAFTINGINGQPNRDGKLIFLSSRVGQAMTIANDSGVDPTAGNRIYTGTGADVTYTGNPIMISLIYNGSASRWELFNPSFSAITTTTLTATTANLTTANVGTLVLTNQLASTNISHTFVRTNFISGALYTNLYGGPIAVSADATLTVAAVSGASIMALECLGNVTNYASLSTTASTVVNPATNMISAVVTNNGTYTFTNRSTGAGNSAGVFGGQIIVY